MRGSTFPDMPQGCSEEKGFDATRGDDIAAAAGISTRTVRRYFRSKEACVEPLLKVGELRFAAVLGQWSKAENISFEPMFVESRKVQPSEANFEAIRPAKWHSPGFRRSKSLIFADYR